MIIIAVVVIFAGIIMSGYNSLVSMNENVNGKWSQVENQLQRRNDLIQRLSCIHSQPTDSHRLRCTAGRQHQRAITLLPSKQRNR